MKTLLLFIAIALLSIGTYAQSTYIPFPDSTANWISWNGGKDLCSCSGCGCLYDEYEQYNMNGDTIIGLYSYKKLYRSFSRHSYTSGPCSYPCTGASNTTEGLPEYFGAIRQNTALKTVYITTVNTPQDQLLYDFNLNVGDTIPMGYIWNIGGYTITKIDSVLLAGLYHKRLIFHPGGHVLDSGYSALIEGIGCVDGFIYQIFSSFENASQLKCLSNNSVPIYSLGFGTAVCNPLNVGIKSLYNNTNTISLAPNPASNNITISSTVPLQNGTVELYNVLQQHVTTINNVNGTTYTIPLNTIANGNYYLQIIENSTYYKPQKIIIQQ